MKMKSPVMSLENFLRSQTAKWSALGFILTLFFSVPCFWYATKVSSEKQILVMAKSAARAFRPQILRNDVRDAQFQMQRALDLKAGESAIVLNQKMEPIYPISDEDKKSKCNVTAPSFCWRSRGLSILYPIYFDDVRQDDLFGYLQLTIAPSVDMNAVGIFILLLTSTFLGLAIGLQATLRGMARQIGTVLGQWASHISSSPQTQVTTVTPPFQELLPMREAVNGLHRQISALQSESAKSAKTEAQLSLLREISHDLRTPHALLAKYFYLHLDTIESTGQVDPDEVIKIDSTLKRMGELLRQVRVVPGGSDTHPSANLFCNLNKETQKIVGDLRSLPETIEKSVEIELVAADLPLMSRISSLALYRIVENLVRNAVEAVEPRRGHICISLSEDMGRSCLVVRDNGPGIDPSILEKIFDFEFTTKPGRGTGLGLGIVNKICQEFGATISVSSELNFGTEFKVTFEQVGSLEQFSNYAEVSHV